MLNTLVLPSDDDQLAGQLLSDAINNLEVILMLILGGTERKQLVDWADQLCNKAKAPDGSNSRHVVWILNPDLPSVRAILDPIFGGASPVVAVLNFYDVMKECITDAADLDPIALEKAFVKGAHT